MIAEAADPAFAAALEPVLELSELLPKALLSTRADAIIAADREGIIRFWGPGAQRIFGYSAAEAARDWHVQQGRVFRYAGPVRQMRACALGADDWALAPAVVRVADRSAATFRRALSASYAPGG